MSSPELERDGADPDLDDRDWTPIPVPGHWGQAPSLADSAGPIVYRRRFRTDELVTDERRWLCFDGIMSDAEVWLDGQHLGDIGVYFAPHRFDVSDLLQPTTGSAPDEHVLVVEVSCPQPGAKAKRSLTGSLQSGPLAPSGSPGGIWRDVRIDTTGPVAIIRARLVCIEASAEQAILQFRVELDATEAGPVRIDTSIVGPDGSTAGGAAEHQVASGENHLEWTATITKPQRWWPASLGRQHCYDVAIAVRAGDRAVSDRRHWRTGLRTASVDDLEWRVNGERLFIKGIAIGPHHRFLAEVDAAQFARDIQAVRDAGLNLIRVHGHITRPELYRAADELGVLIWQDLPLVGTYATGARSGVRAVARAAVDELGHHPSIVAWCGHDEPNGPPIPEPKPNGESVSETTRRLTRHLLPSWNRSVLDPIVRRQLRSADPSRSVITRSGSLPNLVDFNGSDSHLWLGWHAAKAADLSEVIRRWPRLGTFIGAIGSQSVAVRDWPTTAPEWSTAESGAFARYLPRGAYPDGQSWAQATRAYQSELIRSQIETARRLKYRPTGGFCVVCLFDHDRAGGFGVLDAERRSKPALEALVDACRPVVVVCDPPPPIVTPGQRLSLALHVISDLRTELGPVRVSAQARLDGWSVERHWEGHLGADSCSYIGTLSLRAPKETGALQIDLELEAPDRAATNRYRTVVIPSSEAISPANQRRGR